MCIEIKVCIKCFHVILFIIFIVKVHQIFHAIKEIYTWRSQMTWHKSMTWPRWLQVIQNNRSWKSVCCKSWQCGWAEAKDGLRLIWSSTVRIFFFWILSVFHHFPSFWDCVPNHTQITLFLCLLLLPGAFPSSLLFPKHCQGLFIYNFSPQQRRTLC